MKPNSSKIFFDCLTILFLVAFPHFVPLPFYSYAIVCLAVVIVILRRRKETLKDLGLKEFGIKAVGIGIISAVIWVAFMRWVYLPIISNLVVVPEYTEYNFIQNNTSAFLMTIVAAWIVGGFYEEIIFRGFIQRTIENWFHPKYSFWMAGFLTSIVFGLYHWQQGMLGIVAATLGGLFWTYLYWQFNKNLWYPIISHAIFDTITLTLIYFGMFGK